MVGMEAVDWFGPIDLLLNKAARHRRKMVECLVRPEHRPGAPGHLMAQIAAGYLIQHDWQGVVWSELSDFLATVYSIPNIIDFRLGKDDARREVKAWFKGLDLNEQNRRKEFSRAVAPFAARLRKDYLLENQRHIKEHRQGWPLAKVRIVGRWACYIGTPLIGVAAKEEMPIDPDDETAVLISQTASPLPIVPCWSDFVFALPKGERPMFKELDRYLEEVGELVVEARKGFAAIHHGKSLTKPPSIF